MIWRPLTRWSVISEGLNSSTFTQHFWVLKWLWGRAIVMSWYMQETFLAFCPIWMQRWLSKLYLMLHMLNSIRERSTFSAVVALIRFSSISGARMLAFLNPVLIYHILDVSKHLFLFMGLLWLLRILSRLTHSTCCLRLSRNLLKDDVSQLILELNNFQIDFVSFALSLLALFFPV